MKDLHNDLFSNLKKLINFYHHVTYDNFDLKIYQES